MMQQPSHPPHMPAGPTGMPSHPGAVPQYQLAPHPGASQAASVVSTQTTVAAPEPNSPHPADDHGSKRARKRKSPPADGATEEKEEQANRSPPTPAAHHEMPPQPHTTAAPQPTPEQVAAQQHAAAAAHHAQQHHQPPHPPHHQLPPLGHPQHPQGQHMHPSFHFHPHQVPPGYVPVMPVPMGSAGIPGAQHPTQSDGQSSPNSGAAGGRPLNSSKRAEQNRKAQRAFRERRDAHVKALESRSQLLEAALASVEETNRRWEESRQLCETLRMENAQLRAALQAYQQAGAAITQMQQIAQSQQQLQQQQPSGQGDAVTTSASDATPEKDVAVEGQSVSS